MNSVVVTGATGHLGRLVVEDLLAKGHPAERITATGRDTGGLTALAGRGVRTARADFGDPASLGDAFEGADTLLLVSGSEVGKRVDQHRNAIEAAGAAGVGHVVYTSAPKAADTTLVLAPEHKATEEVLTASGLAYTVLRNGWYNENFAQQLDQARETGSFVGSAGEGRVASASRQDLAEAASAVLRDPKAHAGAVHELSGDTAWTHAELAAVLGELLGREVLYRDLTTEEHVAALTAAGLDEGTARFVAALDANIRDGELSMTTGELSRLIGRPTTPVAETLRALV
ncbi:NAD(P)H dehydrogenase (quinone) [Nocardiopsis arvandica]|uniref:NAD(P)H dehydrogenase (Quinone) n=1 Tax=Nocardiopsis sinuspersici TaxID=501010 RepID=A0A7Z0BM19_9ACTN|nr:SDR family oxidoreductase [Nocardiopsis sinuspersici]NYH54840.1 NAD(P)H dehydrogenase (quinone) [Nocardiopsis sinuspersici]